MRIFLALAALVAIALPAQALSGSDCWNTAPATATIHDPTGTMGDLYVDNDLCQTDPMNPCIFSIWVYSESNGISGQQRGDEVGVSNPTGSEWCIADLNVF